MTTATSTIYTANGFTPAFYVETDQEALCFIDASAFVGFAQIERQVGDAWAFVRQVTDQSNTPLTGRDYYRVRVTYLQSGSLTVTFSASANVDEPTDLLDQARGYTDAQVAGAQSVAAAASALATEVSAGFDTYLVAHFDTDGNAEGWDANNVTPTIAGGAFAYTTVDANSAIQRQTSTSFKGRDYYLVKARVTRTAGDPNANWRGACIYNTTTRASMSISNCKTIANPILQIGVPQVLTFDMRSVTSANGATEWTDHDILNIRLGLVSAGGHAFKVDWVAIGRAGPIKSTSGVPQSYVDTADAATLASAKAYTDTNAGGTSQSYVDSGDAATLASAKTYADNAVVVGGSGNFTYGGTGAITRTMVARVKEFACSVVDFGANPSGASDDTTPFLRAIASGAGRITVPQGHYNVDKFVIDKAIWMLGDGYHNTFIHVNTTSDHGIVISGDPALRGSGPPWTANRIKIDHLTINYAGAGQSANKHGVVLRANTMMDGVMVTGFTGTGILTDTYVPGNDVYAPFFCNLVNVKSKDNGLDGMAVRFGSNANTFINCDFSNNVRYGLNHHKGDADLPNTPAVGANTYCNLFLGGQCSYNGQEGWRFQDGECSAFAIYAEGNGRSGGVSHVNTQYDVYVGDGMIRSTIDVGSVPGGTSAIRVPTAFIPSLEVRYHGVRMTSICETIPRLAAGATAAQIVAAYNAMLDVFATRLITHG